MTRTKTKTKRVAEFGDFQTPAELAEAVCAVVKRTIPSPRTIVEPTCGKGAFLVAAARAFPNGERFIGRDVNPEYAAEARAAVTLAASAKCSADVQTGDFFSTDWDGVFAGAAEPILVIGNPPWVTNSELGSLGGRNLPEKSNFQNRAGWDALTGKSNFDVSEWMLFRLLESLGDKHATLAMLCKTAVARKALRHA
ncbi:MAG: N-6 DNA methylase, partial [Planctomycetales bacterium]